jgi:hypothetical protein
VNLAADYALFNALPPHVPALLSWRPWILEEPVLAAKSALFPGTLNLVLDSQGGRMAIFPLIVHCFLFAFVLFRYGEKLHSFHGSFNEQHS